MTRREAMMSFAAVPVLGAIDAGTAPAARAVKPLPFNPTRLKGLSEKLLVSHHDNNYGGALKNLLKVEAELAKLPKDAPGFLVSGLKERELTFRNSVTLHEAYFGSLGGDGKVPQAFSSYEEPLRACALSEAGGSGWALLSLELDTGELNVQWSGNHTQTLAAALPLLVIDMYEHSYALDYGAAAAKYVDAVFANLKWDEVHRRHELAVKASAAWRA
jgi:superoxide dismutase, Fe-Mn family